MLELIKGDAYSIVFELTDENNLPVDITGKTLFFTMKRKSDVVTTDDNALITKDITVHSDPTNGKSILEIEAADWEDVPAGIHVYDFSLEGDDEKPRSTIVDFVTVYNDITKRRWEV